METLKNEIQKTLPYAILFGVIGGVLLIVANNVFDPSSLLNLLIYLGTGITAVVCVLKIQETKEVKSIIYLTTQLFMLMTSIAFLDFALNANKNFINPLFENVMLLPLFLGILIGIGAFLTVSLRSSLR